MSEKKRGRDDSIQRGRVGRRIDPEFDRMVRGEKSRKPGQPRLDDPRQHALVRGVANRDVRTVAEHHRERLQTLLSKESEAVRAELELLLGLEVWRGLSFISKKAFLEDGLSLDSDHWAHQAKPRRDLAEPTIALWYRLESARIRKGAAGSIDIVSEGKKNALQLNLPAENAHHVLEEMGRAMSALVRDDQPRRANNQGDAKRGNADKKGRNR